MACSYTDFYPQILAPGGMFTAPTVESFSVLVERANAFLTNNHAMVPFCCESGEQAVDQMYATAGPGGMATNLDCSMYFEYGKRMTGYIRYLRVWQRPREPSDPPPPVSIACMTVVPGMVTPGGMLTAPQFEDYNSTVNKMNDMFRASPLPGRILNVETQDVNVAGFNQMPNPELCMWYESGRRMEFFINVIRVFFINGPPAQEILSTVDFCPALGSQDTGFMGIRTPVGQSFPEIMGTVNNWIASNSGQRIISVQSINFKMDSSGFSGGINVNTHRTSFYVSGRAGTTYLRVLRIHFTSTGTPVPRPITCITYRTFCPCLLVAGGMMRNPVMETMSQTMNRAVAWMQQAGVRPIAAETLPILFYWNQNISLAQVSEQTVSTVSGRMTTTFVFCLRIYFDSPYQEPPLEALPPVPQVQVPDGGGALCCTIV